MGIVDCGPLGLCMVMVAAVVGVFSCVWLTVPRGRGDPHARRRRGRPAGVTAQADSSAGTVLERPLARLVCCLFAGMTVGWLFLGPASGFVVGAGAGAAAAWWLGRLESPAVTRAREETERTLPLAADLLAACATAGRPPEESLVLVARAIGGPLGDRLRLAAARITLGSDPRAEWGRLLADPQLAPLAQTLLRAARSGAPLADGLIRLGSDRRRERRFRMLARARTVGVKSAAPLAACFLPAFMLIGVVPTVAAAFGQLAL